MTAGLGVMQATRCVHAPLCSASMAAAWAASSAAGGCQHGAPTWLNPPTTMRLSGTPASTSSRISARTCSTASATPSGSNGLPARGRGRDRRVRRRGGLWRAKGGARKEEREETEGAEGAEGEREETDSGRKGGRRGAPFIMSCKPAWSRWLMSNQLPGPGGEHRISR